MTATDKALILGFFLTGLVTYATVEDHGESPSSALAVHVNGNRLSDSADGGATVIEQPDGLLVIDDSLAPGALPVTVAKIQALSAKPVKFLIYSHDNGDRAAQDHAYRDAWPNIVIISTENDPPARYFREAASTALALVHASLAERLTRFAVIPSITESWQSVTDAIDEVVEVYRTMTRTRIKLSLSASRKRPSDNG